MGPVNDMSGANSMKDWLATRSGQLFGCYIIIGLLIFIGPPDKDTSGKLLFLAIGAVLRDMQDTHSPNVPAPQGQKEDK